MLKPFKRRVIASATALALGTSLMAAPIAYAEESEFQFPLGCNVQTDKRKATAFQGLLAKADGVYNSAKPDYSSFQFSMPASAPEEVPAGETFDYTLESTVFPVSQKLSLADVTEVSQVNIWVDLPTNATLEEVEWDKENNSEFDITVTDDNRLLIHGADGAPDLTTWSTNDMDTWQPGGLVAKLNKDAKQFEVVTPKITLRLKATGQPGETIQPTVNHDDPEEFSPNAFVQLYIRAGALGQNLPALVRCGLSEDWSLAETTLASKPFPATTIGAQRYDSEAVVQLQDISGANLGEGVDVIFTDGSESTTVTSEADGVVRASFLVAPGKTKTVLAAFADNPDATEEIVLTGKEGGNSQEFTLKEKPSVTKFDNPVEVALVDANGVPMAKGTKVKVVDAPLEKEYTADADGIVKFNIRLGKGEQKTIQIFYVNEKEVSVSLDLVGGENNEPVKTELKSTKVTKTTPADTKPGNGTFGADGSSLGDVEVPKILGILVSVLLGLEAFAFIIRNITDFFKNMR